MSQLRAYREISDALLGSDVYIDEVYGSSRELGEDIGNLVSALQAVLKVCEEEGEYAGVHPHSIRKAITEALGGAP